MYKHPLVENKYLELTKIQVKDLQIHIHSHHMVYDLGE